MKIFLLSVLVLLALVKNTVAQTYTIPWAQQQPAWVFPLWFEDASGAKDTLYVCYDADAFGGGGGGVWPGDSILGVKKIKIDTSVFYVLIETPYNSIDSIFQCTLSNSNVMPSPTFYVYNCSLPLTIRWDVNLFRSSALPFPDLSPAPRAQGQIVFDLPFFAPPFCAYDAVLLLTDSTYDGNYLGCEYKDSLIFENVFGNNGTSYIGFSIRPWTGLVIGVDNPTEIGNPIFVYPNPCVDWIYVKNINDNFNYRYYIRNVNGTIIKANSFQDCKIDIRNINSGLYIIEIINSTNHKTNFSYFIKN